MNTLENPTPQPPQRTTTPYINNPFFIATEGIGLLFTKARGVAILLLILSALALNGSVFSSPAPLFEGSTSPAHHMQMFPAISPLVIGLIIVLVVLLLIAAIVIGAIVKGIGAYTSVELTKGREVHLKVAFHVVVGELGSFVWLQVLIFVKVVLWSLLFIVPGIIMGVRYSLANMSFFDQSKKLRGNAAITDSLELTKGGWLTTFSSQTLFNSITGGVIQLPTSTGVQAILYRQFNTLRAANAPKPRAHPLTWLTLGIVILIALGVLGISLWTLDNYIANSHIV